MAATDVMAPFVGRARPWETLQRIITGSTAGGGGIAVIEGPAGIGKSRLLRKAAELASENGIAVCAASAHELERRRPFAVMLDALGIGGSSPDPRRAACARLIAGQEPSGVEFNPGPIEQFRIAEALRSLIDQLTAEGPLALLLDDVQWADSATLAWLHRLSRNGYHPPLALVCALRPVPREPDVELMLNGFGEISATRLPLEELDETEALTLAEHLAGGEPGPRLAQEVQRCGGNPLLIIERMKALEAEGVLVRRDRMAELDVPARSPAPAPLSLRMTVLHRLRFLPATSVETLRLASVLGSRFSVADLALLTARPTVEIARAVEEGLRAQVLVESGEGLLFRHDVIREALYHDLPSSVRTALHLEFARRLADAGGPALAVAEHFARGAVAGDPQAARWLHRAATEIGSRSPAAALNLIDRAIELASPDDPVRPRLLFDRAANLFSLGRLAEAEAELRAHLAAVDESPIRNAIKGVLVQIMTVSGRADDALREVDVALACDDCAPGGRAMLLAWAANAAFLAGDLPRAIRDADSAVAAARDADVLPAAIAAMGAKAAALGLLGRLTAAVEAAHGAVAASSQVPDNQGYRFHARVILGILLLKSGQSREAEEVLRHGLRMSEHIGALWNVPLYHWGLMFTAYLQGRWDEAVAEFDAGYAWGVEPQQLVGPLSLRALIALHRDEVGTGGAFLEAAAANFEACPAQYGGTLLALAHASRAEAHGDPEIAFEILSVAWSRLLSGGCLMDLPYAGPDLARLATLRGDTILACQVARHLDALREENPHAAPIEASAHRARAWADRDPQPLIRAAKTYEMARRPYQAALSTEEAAGLMVDHDRSESLRLLQMAVAGYEALGACRDAARAGSHLRALGVRRGISGHRGRPSHGWGSLTPTEARVAQLVAEGLSNPEIAQRMFVSRRTVQSHVSHVLAKLQLRSRVELASAVARRT